MSENSQESWRNVNQHLHQLRSVMRTRKTRLLLTYVVFWFDVGLGRYGVEEGGQGQAPLAEKDRLQA